MNYKYEIFNRIIVFWGPGAKLCFGLYTDYRKQLIYQIQA